RPQRSIRLDVSAALAPWLLLPQAFVAIDTQSAHERRWAPCERGRNNVGEIGPQPTRHLRFHPPALEHLQDVGLAGHVFLRHPSCDWTGRISKCGDAMLRSYLFEAAGVLLTQELGLSRSV